MREQTEGIIPVESTGTLASLSQVRTQQGLPYR